MNDGNKDFDINYKEKYYINIDRVEIHKDIKDEINNESDICSIGIKNIKEKKIDSLFDKKINSTIQLDENIFMFSGSGMILVFEINNNNFICLMEEVFLMMIYLLYVI